VILNYIHVNSLSSIFSLHNEKSNKYHWFFYSGNHLTKRLPFTLNRILRQIFSYLCLFLDSLYTCRSSGKKASKHMTLQVNLDRFLTEVESNSLLDLEFVKKKKQTNNNSLLFAILSFLYK